MWDFVLQDPSKLRFENRIAVKMLEQAQTSFLMYVGFCYHKIPQSSALKIK